jgi:RNA polymerase sigma-54 factor
MFGNGNPALIRQLIGAKTRRRRSPTMRSSSFAGQGIVVARRTIAKYREALMIPPVNLRKAI